MIDPDWLPWALCAAYGLAAVEHRERTYEEGQVRDHADVERLVRLDDLGLTPEQSEKQRWTWRGWENA